jgi:hypothetical protein
VAGVLHDVGRLLIYRAVPDLSREILRSGRGDELLVEIERARMPDDAGVLLKPYRREELARGARDAIESHVVCS